VGRGIRWTSRFQLSDAASSAVSLLRERLIEHRLRRGGVGLVFAQGDDPEVPFAPNTIRQRAKRTWQRAGLDPLTLH
jgi:hypothetical protein